MLGQCHIVTFEQGQLVRVWIKLSRTQTEGGKNSLECMYLLVLHLYL